MAKDKKSKKTPIDPKTDPIAVVKGGEALVEEVGEVRSGTLDFVDEMGRSRGGENDEFRYRVLPSDCTVAQKTSTDLAWRNEGYDRITGVSCINLPGDVYRTGRANAEKASRLKGERTRRERSKEAAPAGMNMGEGGVEYGEKK
jgi:hypothetical protein